MDLSGLVAENTALKQENAELRSALTCAEERIRSLEERLNENSQNSSRPPSSDGPAVKRPPRSRKTGRRRGAQHGHPGHARALVPPEQVDEIVECVPEVCAHCGEVLTDIDPEPERHQVVDVPEPRVIVREYRRHRRRCRSCGRTTVGALPPGVTGSRFGVRLHALAVLLTGGWLLSKRQVASLLQLLYGLEISTGSISAMERRTAEALKAPYAQVREHVQLAPVVHADETSWRQEKNRAWLWVAATRSVAAFVIQRRRNTDAAKVLLGEAYAGTLCVDRWSAYTWVERRGLCWAHLLRDFQAIAERYGSEWHGLRLVAAGQRVLAHWSDWHHGRIDRETMLERIAPERVRIERLLRQGSTATWASAKTRGVCRELTAQRDAMWRFLEEPGLAPTNNLAERSLRRPVIWRKGSFGTDSADGSRFVERILSVVATLKAQGRDPFAYLVDTHVAHAAGQPVPSMLPIPTLPT
jgi:transposase